LDVLSAIKGIGSKNISDLRAVYKNIDELAEAMRKGEHIPLRDDKVEILRKHMIV